MKNENYKIIFQSYSTIRLLLEGQWAVNKNRKKCLNFLFVNFEQNKNGCEQPKSVNQLAKVAQKIIN